MNPYLKVSYIRNFITSILCITILTLAGCVNSEKLKIVNDINSSEAIFKDSYGFEKYATVAKMYSDMMLDKYNEESHTLSYLYNYSDKDLKESITLVKENISKNSQSLDRVKSCEKAILILNLFPSTSYKLDNNLVIDYIILANGKVRSSMLVKDNENINNFKFGTFKDFSLNCQKGSCKITDVFDSEGKSAKTLIQELC